MESSKPSSLFPGLPAPLADKPPSVGTVTFPSAASLFAQVRARLRSRARG